MGLGRTRLPRVQCCLFSGDRSHAYRRLAAFDAQAEHHHLSAGDFELQLVRDCLLPSLYFGIGELVDAAARRAHQMIVRLAVVQFVDHTSVTERDAAQQFRIDQQPERAIQRAEAQIAYVFIKPFVKLFGREVHMPVLLEELQQEHTRVRGPQTGMLQDSLCIHERESNANEQAAGRAGAVSRCEVLSGRLPPCFVGRSMSGQTM